METYALYVRRLCKIINYNILYIKYVERISSSVCVLSKYIMRHTSNPNEKILQKNVLISRNMILHMILISIFLSFHHIFNLLTHLSDSARVLPILFLFVFYAYIYIYIYNARTLSSTCIFPIILSRKIT